ncbi:FAD/NAD(P)-binding protein [Streptomyces hokutonensis]|uniref:FAD/NAD(P)-binding protein n=1 Tax=Streptomyces hokutonensis TaxID=1306990 RepID=UPI003402168F
MKAVTDSTEICIVGAGPRGLSVLERLLANERNAPQHTRLTVHLVDPYPPGAGAVWRTNQSRLLLMNTVTSQITVFTDKSVTMTGPVEQGPSLYEWARSLALLAADDDVEPHVLAEARELGPDSYPTRAFYGHYLRDCAQRIIASAPEHVTVRVHPARTIALTDTHGTHDGPQGVWLEDGARLDHLNAVVLALGHLPTRPTPHEARTADLARIHGLRYVTPTNPADADLNGIAPGERVLLRGLGLNFFDYMALLTSGRGGTYVRSADGGLTYKTSGREPEMWASSRRGIPYHARGENQKGAHGRYYPRLLTPEVVADLRTDSAGGRKISFMSDLWPLISREVESVYYTALTGDPALGEEIVRLPPDADAGPLLDTYAVPETDRWSWSSVTEPHAGRYFTDRADFRDWLLDHLRRDIAQARAGNVDGPLKAALDVLRDLRNEIRLAVDHGGLEGSSHRAELEGWYTPLNAFLSIGPPVSRIEEMTALLKAGVLHVSGPGTEIRLSLDHPDGPVFTAESTEVPGAPVHAATLIEARLPEPDLRRTEDPLLRYLLATEQCTSYVIGSADDTDYKTGGLAVTERPYHLLEPSGRAHPRRFAYGVPTEAVHWVTAAGIRPGVDSVTLGDSDAIARAALALPLCAQPDPAYPASVIV